MSLPYHVWSEDEILNRYVVPKGSYRFRIKNVSLTKTKGGQNKNGEPKPIHDMLQIDFEFTDQSGNTRYIKDWVVFADKRDFKLRYLAEATGTLPEYESKELDCHHLRNKEGLFELGIKEYEDLGIKKQTNVILDYLPKDKNTMPNTASDKSLNEDIPF